MNAIDLVSNRLNRDYFSIFFYIVFFFPPPNHLMPWQTFYSINIFFVSIIDLIMKKARRKIHDLQVEKNNIGRCLEALRYVKIKTNKTVNKTRKEKHNDKADAINKKVIKKVGEENLSEGGRIV